METEKKSHGALIGSIIIIVILIIGGIYIWQSKVKTITMPKNTENVIQTNEITPADVNDLNVLDQDLNTTDTNTGVDVNSIQ